MSCVCAAGQLRTLKKTSCGAARDKPGIGTARMSLSFIDNLRGMSIVLNHPFETQGFYPLIY